MKFLIVLIAYAVLLAHLGCSGSKTISDDWFGISGITYDGKDSTILGGVTIILTDFYGHLQNPISNDTTVSDSMGVFGIHKETGYLKETNGVSTNIYKVDSCKAIFFKQGHIQDSITLTGDNPDSVKIYLQRT